MRPLLLVVLAVSSSGCAFIKGALGPEYAQCETFSQRPISYREEAAIGGAVALALGARAGGGIFVEVAPELASLSEIPAGRYDTTRPVPGKGPKTDLTRYLNLLGKGLAAASERPAIDWTFGVLDSPVPNAFSAPGGYVFVTTGLLRQMKNEAQLAGVLGHEIGHVTGRHALEAYRESKLVSCLVGYYGKGVSNALVRDTLGPLLSTVQQASQELSGVNVLEYVKVTQFDPNALSAPFIKWITNRVVETLLDKGYEGHETDADATAVQLMSFAGYDVAEFEKVIAALPEGKGKGALITHPPNAQRLADIAAAKAGYADFAGAARAPALSPTVGVVK